MKNQTNPKPRRKYDATFKKNAVQMMSDGRSASSVSEALGVHENLLYKWKRQATRTKEEKVSMESEEIKQLRKRVTELEMERDILKKALSIFSRQT